MSNRITAKLSTEPQNGKYVLKLYVVGSTPRSSRAITNVKALCETHLKGRYVLTVIDLYEHPELAREHQIVAAPTLVRKLPKPLRLLLGDMSQTARILVALDLPATPLSA